jgi:hypothetical protein
LPCRVVVGDDGAVNEQLAAGVFVSYRRHDTAHVAGRLSDHLARRFGAGQIFMDVASIRPGSDFPDTVAEALERSAVLLALIGKDWVSSMNATGGRRLDDPDDWVVHEIRIALERGIRVIPVLADGAALPQAADLPEVLTPLLRRQAVRVDHETFGADVEALINAVSPGRGTDETTASDVGSRLFVSPVDRIVDPIRLGVHPAALVEAADGSRNRAPPFVPRDVFAQLRAALVDDRFVLVVGDSTAGKTRLAFEAMRECLPGYCCVAPEWAEALVDAVAQARARRPAVLWLDDLERFLGEEVLRAAGLSALLDVDDVVVLATMRAHEYANFGPRYDVGVERGGLQGARVGRTVLSRATEIRLERMWSKGEVAAAAKVGDLRITQALASAQRYGLAEVMAAGPQMLGELRNAWSVARAQPAGGGPVGDPRGAALVTAAVDIRLIGYHKPVPLSVLRELHEVYLRARGGAVLRPGSWKNAVAWATQPIHATSSLLEPGNGKSWLAFDYLVDAAARDPSAPPVPDETWRAFIDHAALPDAVEIAWQACLAGRPEHACAVAQRAIAQRGFAIAARVASCLGNAGEEQIAVDLLQHALEWADGSGQVAPEDLLAMRRTLAWELGAKRGGYGNPARALEIARRVAADAAELWGDTHPDALFAQLVVARQLGGTGAAADALAMAQRVCNQASALLGSDHDVVDGARFEVAAWTRRVHGPVEAAKRFRELLTDLQQRPATDVLSTIDIEWNLGSYLLEAGDSRTALPILKLVTEKAEARYGRTFARSLGYRHSYIEAVAAACAPGAALGLAHELVTDCCNVLGADHLMTLKAKYLVAMLVSQAGDGDAAARLFEALHSDVARVLGDDHWLADDARRHFTAADSTEAHTSSDAESRSRPSAGG